MIVRLLACDFSSPILPGSYVGEMALMWAVIVLPL
jgi:hypothetical protein